MALMIMTESHPLSKILTSHLVQRLAGDRYYQRGVDYLRRGRVTEFEASDDSIEAIVEGTEEYAVRLTAVPDGLEWDCNCPLGLDGEFCKHCVAVALKWLEGQAGVGVPKAGGTAKRPNAAKVTDEDIAAALDAVDKAALVKMVLEWAEDDRFLKDRLTHKAARNKGPEAAIAQARKTLEKAIRVRRYVEYREMRSYAATVETAIDSVEELLRAGHASGVMELCEAGVRWLSAACEQVDDSDGYMSSLMDRLHNMYLQACKEAKPDPKALAAKLFQNELRGGFDAWSGSLEAYAEVLGEEGLATYRSMAEAEWAKVPFNTEAGAASDGQSYFKITEIMKTLARRSGNIEEQVAVLERDLSNAYGYQEIARIYREACDYAKALAWAERGMKAFSGYYGAGLRRIVAEEYRRADRHADALRIVWVEFRDAPSLEGYKRLEEFALAADDWEEWRAQALAHVRRTVAGKARTPDKVDVFIQKWGRRSDRSLLVEIFLHEGKVEEAWDEAKAGECSEGLWLRQAELRERMHPADAQAIYFRLGERDIQMATGNYDSGVALLERAAGAARSAGKSPEFQAALDSLLVKYKAKRNLLKRVDVRRRLLYLPASVV